MNAQAGNHVLYVGCGMGHGTALIASLCSSIVGIDEDQAFVDAAIANLWQLDISMPSASAASGSPINCFALRLGQWPRNGRRQLRQLVVHFDVRDGVGAVAGSETAMVTLCGTAASGQMMVRRRP
jgi:trans-aconitate methyltransferase